MALGFGLYRLGSGGYRTFGGGVILTTALGVLGFTDGPKAFWGIHDYPKDS